MHFQTRLPIPVAAVSTRSLRRMQSDTTLQTQQSQVLYRVHSLGQLSPAPDEPLPPLPLEPPLHSLGTVRPNQSSIRPTNPRARFRNFNGNSTMNSHHSQDGETDIKGWPARETMHFLHDGDDLQGDALALEVNPNHMPSRDELSQILQFRGRLQQMGTTFTPEGEIWTYGDPQLEADLHHMLRLGPLYDNLWSKLFKGGCRSATDQTLCQELQVLKRMLHNDGVHFDAHHKRLSYGTFDSKIVRLSDWYDILLREWMEETLQNVHPAFRPGFCADEVPMTTTDVGWELTLNNGRIDRPIRTRSRHSSPLGSIDEEQPSLQHGSGPEVLNAVTDDARLSPAPEASISAGIAVSEQKFGTVPYETPRDLASGRPPLLHGMTSSQVASTARGHVTDSVSDEQEVISGYDGHNRTAVRNSPKHEHDVILAAPANEGQRRTETQQQMEFSNLNESAFEGEKPRTVKRGKRAASWLKALLGMKGKGAL